MRVAESRLLFKFRSRTRGLNEDLGRYAGRKGKVECTLCCLQCESIVCCGNVLPMVVAD